MSKVNKRTNKKAAQVSPSLAETLIYIFLFILVLVFLFWVFSKYGNYGK